MRINKVTLWIPEVGRTDYTIDGTIRWDGQLQKIHGIELSPTSEVVILREDGGATVFGYVPYELSLVRDEEASKDV